MLFHFVWVEAMDVSGLAEVAIKGLTFQALPSKEIERVENVWA